MGKLLWVKGAPSPNPTGKPKKGFGLAAILTAKGNAIALAVDPDTGKEYPDGRADPQGRTQREVVIDRLYWQAMHGSMTHPTTLKAIEILFDREYGKALDRIEFVGEQDEPPTLQELHTLIKLREDEAKSEPANGTA